METAPKETEARWQGVLSPSSFSKGGFQHAAIGNHTFITVFPSLPPTLL